MVSRWLLINNSEKYSKRYSQAGFNLKKDIEKIESNNEMDIKEKENMRDYSYFTTILNNINYEDITNYEEHQRYLLLSMLILQAPVRTSFYILYYIILYYTILYHTILYYTILYYTIIYYTILYYTVLYYTIIYYTIQYHTVLYYTILY